MRGSTGPILRSRSILILATMMLLNMVVMWGHCCPLVVYHHIVNHLREDPGGLHLDSTATLHTEAGVQLWLRCPRHQGQLTGAPSCSNPVEARAFSW